MLSICAASVSHFRNSNSTNNGLQTRIVSFHLTVFNTPLRFNSFSLFLSNYNTNKDEKRRSVPPNNNVEKKG